MTAIEIENDLITMVRWKIQADDQGLLKVTRNIIYGPDPVAKFDMR